MRWLWIQFVAVFCLLVVSGGLYTNAYFFDWEGNQDNQLSATTLDVELQGPPIGGTLCMNSERLSTEFLVSNPEDNDFSYQASVVESEGELCGAIIAQLRLSDETLYDGLLSDLVTEELLLSANTSAELKLRLRLDPGAETTAGTCSFGMEVSAYQPGFQPETAYFDLEKINNVLSGSTSGVGGSCVPATSTVLLQINKQISGDSQGYELNEFSYHVIGSGIDVVVPHDGTVALPVGTYSIEELVPEDFAKPDWRIGWYGTCERGSTFATTIEINEGNVDHGTLWCVADNQYRPGDDNGNEEEIEENDLGDDFALVVIPTESINEDENSPVEVESETEAIETESTSGEGTSGQRGERDETRGQR